MATPKTIPIRVEDLARYYANLARALTECGISASQLNEILSTRLQARCVKCDIQIASDEIEQVSLAEDATQLSHPKLKRLRLGYCAREGCESYDYWIRLEDFPGVDWATVTKKAGTLVSGMKAEAQGEEKRQTTRKRNRRVKRVAVGLIIVVMLILLRFVVTYGRLPFTHKPHKYEIDPASASPGPRR